MKITLCKDHIVKINRESILMGRALLSDDMNYNTKPGVAVVAFPSYSYAPYKFLSNLLKILDPISDKIVLIDGNTDRIEITSKKIEVRDIGIGMHYIKDIKPTFYSMILWIIKCILAQVKASIELFKAKKDVDCVIFYMAYPFYLLPLIVSKLLKKKTVEVITRSPSNSIVAKLMSLQDPILYKLIDGISPESNVLIKKLGLEKYGNKLLPEGARFIDLSCYYTKKQLSERKDIVGFISRVTKEKGIIEFVKAIPLLAKEKKDIEFLIGGSGNLLKTIEKECMKTKKEHKVKIIITGFIKEEDFQNWLNELKLLILPTQHAEGLPTIILESMACGTPVLATTKGAISEVIKDTETGFILEDNSPECIAENVIRALYHPHLDMIAENARKLIEREFEYEASIKRWVRILNLELREDY